MSTQLKNELQDIINGKEFLEEEDRLSNLPDNLLITILSLLPIDSAATTSVLSHRWRHLWTHITRLSFPPPPPPYKLRPSFDKFQNFETTINLILSQLSSSKIHTFSLSISIPFPFPPFDEQFLFRWISQICPLNPQVFQVFCISNHPFRIPNFVLQTQSIEQLQLDFKFKFDGNLSISVPNLKKLWLRVDESQLPFMGTLFKSIPNLEHLSLKLILEEQGHVVDILLPNLLFLSLNFNDDRYADDCKFVIDAPKLEEFHFHGELAFCHFVNKLSVLQIAKVGLDVDERSNNHLAQLQGICQGISCVRSLTLYYCLPSVLNSFDAIDVPVFRNVVHVCLTCVFVDQNHQLPSFLLLANLKEIELSEIRVLGIELELEFMKFILSNATVLEKLRISVEKQCVAPEVDRLSSEYEFCKELFLLSRSSLNCRIEFSGEHITASSNNFRNGVLAYQTVCHS